MKKKRTLTLSKKEKETLHTITSKGKYGARIIKRAKVLLKSAQGYTNKEIASYAEVSESTVERIRARFLQGGIHRALYDAQRSGQPKKLDAKTESHLIAIACSDAPEGAHHWTLDLLQKRLVKDKKVKTISTVAIWKHLKNRGIKPWLEKNVVHS